MCVCVRVCVRTGTTYRFPYAILGKNIDPTSKDRTRPKDQTTAGCQGWRLLQLWLALLLQASPV